MIVFGITGGSGSGKTTFSKLLNERGVEIIDTDAISREIVKKGEPCLGELCEHFGSEILLPDGTLDRKKLASIAFSNEENIRALNSITHKYIKAETEDRIKSSSADLIAIDGAVIIGSTVEQLCAFIVSVLADRETRIERIKERDGITEAEARVRLDAQPDDMFYKKNSLYIIYNSRTPAELKEQADDLLKRIKERNIE